jgi:nitrite reductase/ring-hydroxylating ferredoxin subunit
MDRRELLRGAAALGVVGAAAPLLAACGDSDSASPGSTAQDSSEAAGDAVTVDLSTIAEGSFVVTQSLVVIKDGSDVKAYSAICPHQNCPVDDVSDGEISCPCHGSRFSVADGSVIAGPATRGLTPATVSVDGTTATVTLA